MSSARNFKVICAIPHGSLTIFKVSAQMDKNIVGVILLMASRSSGLAKTILQGTVKRKRKRGRQKKRWEDTIKKWTGMDFASSTRAAENRSSWKGIVAKSSVVPRRPSKVMG